MGLGRLALPDVDCRDRHSVEFENPRCLVPVLGLRLSLEAQSPAGTVQTESVCAHRKPIENQGTNTSNSSAMNNAVMCGHTRGIATSGETRPIAQAA